VQRFEEQLVGVGGHLHRARGEQEASRILADLVAAQGARRIARSDAPLVRRTTAELAHRAELFDGWKDRRRLLECDLGVTAAQWGIAETGTLVLDAQAERNRLTSLVPPIHIALLEAPSIVLTLGEALKVAAPDGRPPSTLTFITGPSRTADIELVLVVGVHGPRELHVVLIESPSP
jgi:L-lactate dehydrogenase complex protein LldG